jgi:sugar lactone lactonase YvrE
MVMGYGYNNLDNGSGIKRYGFNQVWEVESGGVGQVITTHSVFEGKDGYYSGILPGDSGGALFKVNLDILGISKNKSEDEIFAYLLELSEGRLKRALRIVGVSQSITYVDGDNTYTSRFAGLFSNQAQELFNTNMPLPNWECRETFISRPEVIEERTLQVINRKTYIQARSMCLDINPSAYVVQRSEILNGEFKLPRGIALDSSDNIYVADSSKNRIQIFEHNQDNDQYKYKNTIGGKWGRGNYQFMNPTGVALDKSGNIYVADTLNYRIQIFNPGPDDSYEYKATIGGELGHGKYQFNRPNGVALDNSDNIYVAVADTYNNRIQIFNRGPDDSYEYKATIGGELGSGDNQFNIPFGVALDKSGKIYVADTWNHRIQIFEYNQDDKQFEVTTSLGKKYDNDNPIFGTGDGEFNYPKEVALDSVGNLYVVDTENHRIQIFNPGPNDSYKYKKTIGTGEGGSENNQFKNPFGVALDSSSNIYVADTYNHRIQIFSHSRP